jgi:hypothetical protein
LGAQGVKAGIGGWQATGHGRLTTLLFPICSICRRGRVNAATRPRAAAAVHGEAS